MACKPKFDGHTIGVWRHRLIASEVRLSTSSTPEKVQATITRYREIIAELETIEAAQEAEDQKPQARAAKRRLKAIEKIARTEKKKVTASRQPKAQLLPTDARKTPWGIAREQRNGDLIIFHPQPEYPAWCARHEHYLRRKPRSTDPGYLYIGPIIIESNEEPPEGFEEYTEHEHLAQLVA